MKLDVKTKKYFKCALRVEMAVLAYLFMACVPASIASAQAAALFWSALRCPAAAVKNRLYN